MMAALTCLVANRRPAIAAAAMLAVLAAVLAGSPTVTPPLAAQGAEKWAAKTSPAEKSALGVPDRGAQAIVVLVNDEPITAYEIEQRAAFLLLATGAGGPDLNAKAQARWAAMVKDKAALNERFQQFMRTKKVSSEAEAKALQPEFVDMLRRELVEKMKKEAGQVRNTALAANKGKAQEELIEERLKLQEAKKVGVEVSDDDVNRTYISQLAKQNGKTEAEFAAHLKSMGVDITTLRERYRALVAWREVVRRRFAAQIAVNQRDIDRLITTSASEAGEDTVELQLRKITLPVAGGSDETARARRFVEAESLQLRFRGCDSMADLARGASDARYEDLKLVKPSAIPEPTRSLLLAAKDGDIMPPITAAGGIEMFAVCSRTALRVDDAKRSKAQEELQIREFEILARRHLRDLRQDALIEFRN
jgi:peptidyl-prolyl cis-trans isomerase SurA